MATAKKPAAKPHPTDAAYRAGVAKSQARRAAPAKAAYPGGPALASKALVNRPSPNAVKAQQAKPVLPTVSPPAPDAVKATGATPPAASAGTVTDALTGLPVSSDTSTAAGKSAMADLTTYLKGFGLDSLAGAAWDAAVKGYSGVGIIDQLRSTDAYKQLFPNAPDLFAKGIIKSEGDILTYRQSARELLNAAGIKPGVYDDNKSLDTLLAGNVNPTELKNRLDLAVQDANTFDATTKAQFQRLYGVDDSMWNTYFLDPTKGLPLIQKQVDAVVAGGAAAKAGYGNLTAAQAEMVGNAQGNSMGSDQQGFAQLTKEQQLMGLLPGEQGTAITQDQGLAAQFGGDAASQQAIDQRAAARRAALQGGSNASVGNAGIGGFASQQ